MKKLLDYHADTGMKEIFHHDPHTGESTIETVQDVEPYLEVNKKLQNMPEYSKQGMKDEFLHYAFIPDSIILKWKVELGIDVYNPNDKKAVFKLLNDPEYLYLKTTKMHHAPKSNN